ncbi:hypothetical protein J7E83_13835, partial [Arthrobacter sp. ISL-48]|nr:hypothetical protein [Arthrobacter sp. ISL-48]
QSEQQDWEPPDWLSFTGREFQHEEQDWEPPEWPDETQIHDAEPPEDPGLTQNPFPDWEIPDGAALCAPSGT